MKLSFRDSLLVSHLQNRPLRTPMGDAWNIKFGYTQPGLMDRKVELASKWKSKAR
jgi:hypothetical protein